MSSHADLSAAVDVYSDWVDACDAVAKEDGDERARNFALPRAPASERPAAGRTRNEDEYNDDDNDDEIMENEDGLGGYRGAGIVADDEDEI